MNSCSCCEDMDSQDFISVWVRSPPSSEPESDFLPADAAEMRFFLAFLLLNEPLLSAFLAALLPVPEEEAARGLGPGESESRALSLIE